MISWKLLTRHNLVLQYLPVLYQVFNKQVPVPVPVQQDWYLPSKDLTTTSCNNFQQDVKIKVLITIIIALLFPNLRLVLC